MLKCLVFVVIAVMMYHLDQPNSQVNTCTEFVDYHINSAYFVERVVQGGRECEKRETVLITQNGTLVNELEKRYPKNTVECSHERRPFMCTAILKLPSKVTTALCQVLYNT